MKTRSINTLRRKKTPADKVTQVVKDVVNYIEEQGVKLDKASLAKYILLAIAVVYGIRKTNILSSLTISLITGLVTKLLADKLEGEATLVQTAKA